MVLRQDGEIAGRAGRPSGLSVDEAVTSLCRRHNSSVRRPRLLLLPPLTADSNRHANQRRIVRIGRARTDLRRIRRNCGQHAAAHGVRYRIAPPRKVSSPGRQFTRKIRPGPARAGWTVTGKLSVGRDFSVGGNL